MEVKQGYQVLRMANNTQPQVSMGHLWSLIHSPQLHPLKQNGVCETLRQGSVKVSQPPSLPHCREARLCLAFSDQGPSRVVTVSTNWFHAPCLSGLPKTRPEAPPPLPLPRQGPFPFTLTFFFFAPLPLSLPPTPVVMSSAKAQGQGEPESNSCPPWGNVTSSL